MGDSTGDSTGDSFSKFLTFSLHLLIQSLNRPFMKKLLFLFVLLSSQVIGQTTLIPDANFEQALIDLGYDTGFPDGSVPTSNINTIDTLFIAFKSISDLTGIADFTALIRLNCGTNQLTSLDVSNNTSLNQFFCSQNLLTSLDVSNNTALTVLSCSQNQLTSLDLSNNTALTTVYFSTNLLTSLDVSNNTALTYLSCWGNQLTSLDVSNNTALTELACSQNQLTSIDLSNNAALTTLYCGNNLLTSLDLNNNTAFTVLSCEQNQLTCLNVKNGNNVAITSFWALNNPSLNCIEVDDTTWSTANWANIDSQTSFSNNCGNPCSSITGIPELLVKDKQLLLITDLLGRPTSQPLHNQVMFYRYSDGSVEKRIILE